MAPNRDEILAALGGGLFGGIALGLILQLLTDTLPDLGGLLGLPTLAGGWIFVLGSSLVLGAGYAFIQARYVDQYIAVVLSITSRWDIAKSIVLPLTQRFGMGEVVTSAMGVVYGLVIGVGFGGLLAPVLVPGIAFLDPVVVMAYILFGGVLGGIYGKLVLG